MAKRRGQFCSQTQAHWKENSIEFELKFFEKAWKSSQVEQLPRPCQATFKGCLFSSLLPSDVIYLGKFTIFCFYHCPSVLSCSTSTHLDPRLLKDQTRLRYTGRSSILELYIFTLPSSSSPSNQGPPPLCFCPHGPVVQRHSTTITASSQIKI